MSEYRSQVKRTLSGSTDAAAAYFEAKLAFETDPPEVKEDLEAGVEGLVVLDVRSRGAYKKSHVPGSINLPFGEITEETAAELPDGVIVAYCWGPGCNGAAQAALALSRLGRTVKEMMGGWEYWLKEGYDVEGKGREMRSYAGTGG